MYRLSDIVSKQVVSLKGAHVLGTAIDVLFSGDLKKADSLLLSDPEENDDKFLRLALGKVFRLDGDAIVVRSLSSPLFAYLGAADNPAGRLAYGASGKLYGVVTDVEWDENFNVTAFYAGENVLAGEKLLSFSREIVTFNDTDEDIVLPKSRPHPPKPRDKAIKVKASAAATTDASVTAASTRESLPESGMKAEPKGGNGGALGAEAATVTTPTGALGNREYDSYTVGTPTTVPKSASEIGAPDFSFLEGKRVTRALYSSSGRTIAAENSIITPATIADAACENKLVQLALRAGK